MENEYNEIGEIVRKMENNYITGTTQIGKYVEFSLYENNEKIDAYLNSKHISGSQDSLGRDKPFFNIVTAAVNIWHRATDIDRRNIVIRATKSQDITASYLANIVLQEWMRKTAFGTFLNEWGRSLARYGSTVIKFVEKDGELYPQVIPWNRLIIDPIDFDANVKIEKLYFTEAQLLQNKAYDQEVVKGLLEETTTRKLLDGNKVDNQNDYIEVYEVHGELPLEYITHREEDSEVYVQQMHVVSFVAGRDTGTFKDFTLVSGREKKDPYMITHLIKEDGRATGIGAVEHLFEAQWMVNHTAKAIKDQLDLASKLIFQTSDGSFVGQNALSSIESGDILVYAQNQPLTQLNNNSHDITSLQSFGGQWKALAQEITSTPDSLMGSTAPSGTAWRQVEAIQQEAHSLFELMVENKGLDIEKMMREYVIPHLKKKLDTQEEVSAILESHDITKIDQMFIPNEAVRRANKKAAEQMLNNEIATLDVNAEMANITKELSTQGNQRFFKPSDIDSKTWKEVFANLEWDLEVDVTGEGKNTQLAITTFTTVLQTIASNPGILDNPNAKLVFNKILEATGQISPIEIASVQQPVQQAPAQVPQMPTPSSTPVNT